MILVIVGQSESRVVERFGAYKRTLNTGIHLVIPVLDKVRKKIDMREQVIDFPPQPVITKDNVTMQIDTVVFYQITDPKLYTYGISNPIKAIENLTTTTLRNIIGELELDETLTSRDVVNTQMRALLDDATDPWGIKVTRVEVKNIIPPKDIREAMEKQMKAERERRESILQAEGQKRSAVLEAEGAKQSAILRAEATKEETVRIAEAEKQKLELEANGRANAIAVVSKAEAEAIKVITKVIDEQSYIALKSFEAMKDVADGQATKLIIPSNMQDLTGTVASIGEILKNKE